MSLGFLAAIVKKRADLADIGWGPGFMLVAWVSLFCGRVTVYGLILNVLVTLWGGRLALHLFFRNRNRSEDFRYQNLKQRWKKNFNLKLFSEVFLLQGCILFIVALPIIWVHTHSQDLSMPILGIALPIWLSGFILESLADWELVHFKKDPSNKGRLLTEGTWSYVRHPNYLGELMQWWSIWLLAAYLPFGYALIISPLLLTYLIVNVSGIKPLDEAFQKRPEFKAYVESTPSLIPPSLVNGLMYGAAWSILVIYGAKSPAYVSILTAIGCYIAQLILFAKFDRTSLRLCLPLSMMALGLGFIQEMIFIHFKILAYPEEGSFPPFWILALYPLFALTLNSSLAFLNKNLALTFFLGGIGALFSYLSGQRFGSVQLFLPLAYLVIFVFWGGFLTVLILINRKLTVRKAVI